MEIEYRRVFLGWERPLLGAVVEWLWARREEMPGMLVVVPTKILADTVSDGLGSGGNSM